LASPHDDVPLLHRRGEISAGFELWRALNVELWARAFLDS
jgi:hypothetical protein